MPRGQKFAAAAVAAEGRFAMKTNGGGDWGLPLQSDRTHARASEETDRPAAAARRIN
jgi:hypothetical protein